MHQYYSNLHNVFELKLANGEYVGIEINNIETDVVFEFISKAIGMYFFFFIKLLFCETFLCILNLIREKSKKTFRIFIYTQRVAYLSGL